ncbi:rhomboid family intramembrane serine protease [Prosthecobacter sp.]|uniref:rhomboid family intramembrane serine protease n=1 Tax=Prosthecobacter sp. TaxID=1965333 RepID=UPI001D7C09DC|nr:rhomboid family intramembrane serine protease [Prosthecobacter sp.]MCB1277299.1 rhomboid family intramembrane serine protease [Prosthecobacter sp.]
MHTRKQRFVVTEGCPLLAGILLAVSLGLLTVAVQCIHGLPEALQWSRSDGVEWTWLTSHLCHWSWNHLGWDLFAFGLLSMLCLRLMPSRYAACLLVSSVLIPLEVQVHQPLIESYRGLSGLDTALMGMLVAALWRCSSDGHSWGPPQWLALVGGGSFLAKTLYELTTGDAVFVAAASEPFVTVISAHQVGFMSGFWVGIVRMRYEHGLECPNPKPMVIL